MKTAEKDSNGNRGTLSLNSLFNHNANIGTGERVLSTVAGVLLTAAGALISSRNQRPLTENWKNWYQLVVFPVGAFLIKRGVSGYVN